MVEESRDKIVELIESLKNEYEFLYYYSHDELENMEFELSKAAIDDKFLLHPIYFATGEKKDVISVMAFGGCIGWILLEDKEFMVQIDSTKREKIMSFAKYLSPKNAEDICYINEHKHKIFLPKKFVEESGYSNKGKTLMEDLLNKETSVNQILCNKKYLDLMVCAAYVRYMHRRLEEKKGCADEENRKTEMYDTSERSIQTVIARKNLDNAKNQNLLVIDIEFKQSYIDKNNNNERVTPSVDFVVLDKEKKTFGLIEFKFQGKSMDPKDKNSLTKHFKDFANLIHFKQEKIVKRLIEHTEVLVKKNILEEAYDGEIEGILNEIKENVSKEHASKENAPKELLWCGFYFVDKKWDEKLNKKIQKMEKVKNTSRDGKKMFMEDRIAYDCYEQIINAKDDQEKEKKQQKEQGKEREKEFIKFGIDLSHVRFQHADLRENDFWQLRMDSDFVKEDFEGQLGGILEDMKKEPRKKKK